ncbi:MAG: tRNA (5-methylaminomethyl-2-thiouridine)(34)-methyltransferase MnmD [Bacteroidales bacterium]|jgi:tRNA U34 5-methylaminomethyl-2-thiouridine-forming methyltransferase MnmC|nr:tRNA (5-methylaminomethyl-2-thiouridine)(34)-methyltransferase MnmD [Bacteroidales bacterium]
MPVTLTADGSKTIFSEHFGEHYHSAFGAASESNHVFIDAGYLAVSVNPVSVLEIGFGTGLNAWLTLQQADRLQKVTRYEAIELYPIDNNTASELSDDVIFQSLHTTTWEQPVGITSCFVLYKRKSDLLQTAFTSSFDVVYFDAFSPVVQPGMWGRDIFANLYAAMNPGAVLTTYCAKGDVRRTMQSVGFAVERLPGPIGKREMLRARKIKDSHISLHKIYE